MSKNDPTGKQHATVTPTSSQPKRAGTYSNNESSATGPGSPVELKTPKNILSGLSGVLADCAANDSASKAIGKGHYFPFKAATPGIHGKTMKPNSSSSSSVGR